MGTCLGSCFWVLIGQRVSEYAVATSTSALFSRSLSQLRLSALGLCMVLQGRVTASLFVGKDRGGGGVGARGG